MSFTQNQVFSEKQYIAIAERAAKYYRESPKSQLIPLQKTPVPDAMQYRYRKFDDIQASYGTHQWNQGGTRAQSNHKYIDFNLEAQEMELEIPKAGLRLYNSDNLLAEARREQIEKWTHDVDDAIFHGVIDETENVKLCDGLLDRGANTVQDLSSASDHDLSTKGEIWRAINGMIDEIPFRIRESNPPMILFVSEGIDKAVRQPDRIYQDKNEFDFIYENLIGEKASNARKIGQWVVTNKILAEAYDDTAGNNADSADTKGTHDRMLLLIPNKDFVARVVSRNFSLVGEDTDALNIHQIWGWRGAGCVFIEAAVKYSEALTV
jgi:hypothetical protein